MPETTVHEYDLHPCDEDDIRFSGQITSVKPIPVAKSVQTPAYLHLWRSTLAPNALHQAPPGIGRKVINHSDTELDSTGAFNCSTPICGTYSVLAQWPETKTPRKR